MHIFENLPRGTLVEHAVRRQGARLTNAGALVVYTGEITGRSPNGKYIVMDDLTRKTVDWSNNNPMTEKDWDELAKEFDSFEETRSSYKYIESASACACPGMELNVEVHCEKASHALFVKNMFRKPVEGSSIEGIVVRAFPSVRSEPIVAINFSKGEVLISGTSYAGEIKKSVFTYLNFILPSFGVLPMHCSVNCDLDGSKPAVFFGLSGTGKTTLSADPERILLGDDEHGWSSSGLFNFEGGCYAKTLGLNPKDEPAIWAAANRFGSIFENVTMDYSGMVNFHDDGITKNGRVSYPISSIGGAIGSGYINRQPRTVIMLTCDAFGVLPAVSKLSVEEAGEQFLLGYTSKVAGTESGVDEPQATFSPCFGLPFMPRPPIEYANMLQNFIEETGSTCWLVNTGWTGGPPGMGERIDLDTTRAIVNFITRGEMDDVPTFLHEETGMTVPDVGGLDRKLLHPELAWSNPIMYNNQLAKFKNLIENR